jgi:peptidoglycan/xylan/chitin deacetylase (PgdA/CDA1 family)
MQKILIDYLFQTQRLPEIPIQMMSEKEIFMLHQAGFTIGSHTHTHPIFSQITLRQCQDELVRSKKILEKILEAPVSYFAYPNGVPNKDFQKEHQILVKKAGYDFAFSTSHGKLQSKTNVFACPRAHHLPSFLS